MKCLIELDEFKEARTWVNKGLEIFPDNPDLLAAEAWVLAKMLEIDDTMQLVDKAMMKREPSKYVWLTRGFILLFTDSKNASYCLNKVLEGNPQDWFLNLSVGNCYLQHAKFGDAKYYLDKATQLCPTNPLVWFKLGKCYEGLGFYNRAEYYHTKCLSLNPKFKADVETTLNRLRSRGIISRMVSQVKKL